jgi:glycosyltransferase involved in cell wall biosynthesis
LCASDQVFVVSQALHEFVTACGASASRVQLLPNAVDPQRFVAADDGHAVRAQYGLHGKRVIGFVGSLKPWHGTETLVEAFYRVQSMVPSTHLLIVGDGPCRQDLEAYTQTHALGPVVTFTGNVPYEDIPQYIAAMDITVAPYIPSDNFYYSPLKMFEYMVMGKPVVAGRIGQVEEVLRHRETGMLFEPGDIAQLSAVLTELLGDSALCRRLGSQAKVWVQQERTWESNAQQVITTAQRLRQEYGLVATTR